MTLHHYLSTFLQRDLPRYMKSSLQNSRVKDDSKLEQAQGLLPYLCSASAVFGLVLIGELIALALVLMDSSLSNFSWAQLGYVSMVVQNINRVNKHTLEKSAINV